jgi:hypothetical protein
MWILPAAFTLILMPIVRMKTSRRWAARSHDRTGL